MQFTKILYHNILYTKILYHNMKKEKGVNKNIVYSTRQRTFWYVVWQENNETHLINPLPNNTLTYSLCLVLSLTSLLTPFAFLISLSSATGFPGLLKSHQLLISSSKLLNSPKKALFFAKISSNLKTISRGQVLFLLLKIFNSDPFKLIRKQSSF